MAIKPIKSLLLKIALGVHNACTFIALNILMWRNNLWKKEKWTKRGEKSPDSASFFSEEKNDKPNRGSSMPQTIFSEKKSCGHRDEKGYARAESAIPLTQETL